MATAWDAHSMKVLLSALACEPGKGSELEVGFQTMLAAASKHDVWVSDQHRNDYRNPARGG